LEEYDVVTDEEKKEFITMIRDSSKDLQEMLEILLSLVKINQGILPITIRNINLNKLLINNVDFLKLQAINKDIELVNNYSGDLDVQVDKSYLDIILRNLLSNSLKFTNPRGKIVIDVDENYIDENITGKNITDKSITGDFLKVTIEDNGIGIPENIKAQIFHFDKLITSVGINKEAGNGLGLLLCKEFVEKMGGKIWFESEENKGIKILFRK
jgi:signal transduction histidine kinase